MNKDKEEKIMKKTGKLTGAYCPQCNQTKEFDEYSEGRYFRYKCRTCEYLAKGKILRDD